MQIRRGTTNEWSVANPVLAAGELGYDTDQNKFKIGDGSTAWNSLAFATGPAGATGLNPIYSVQGTVSPLVGTHRVYAERSGTVAAVRASVGTAPTGSAILVDVNKNGTSILSSPISIAIGSNTAVGTINNFSVSAGDYFTVDIDQVGSSTAGANLTVAITIS